MSSTDPIAAFEERLERLARALTAAQRTIDKLTADHRRMREMIRLAEQELRKRRAQIEALERELAAQREEKIEAKARVEQALAELDAVLAQTAEERTG